MILLSSLFFLLMSVLSSLVSILGILHVSGSFCV